MLLVIAGCKGDADDTGETAPGSTGPGSASAPTSNEGSDDAIDSEDTAPLPDIGLPPSLCQMSCDNRETCLGESAVACGNTCDADHATHTSTGVECVVVFEALLGCVAGLSCDDLMIYAAPPSEGEYPCSLEDADFTETCLLDGEPPPETCDAYCAVLSMCEDITMNECSAGCTMQIEFAEGLSEECGTAQTMLLDCIGTLDCATYEMYLSGEDGYPCSAEDQASQIACQM